VLRRIFGPKRDGWIVSTRIFGKYGRMVGLGLFSSRCKPMVGCCEHGNKPSVSIKGREFLD
jgi:hypothetical protein